MCNRGAMRSASALRAATTSRRAALARNAAWIVGTAAARCCACASSASFSRPIASIRTRSAARATRPRAVFWNQRTHFICDATALLRVASTPFRRKTSVRPNW
eukprot:scaffold137695_cov27-Tisochrysis_lutea.AAC.7